MRVDNDDHLSAALGRYAAGVPDVEWMPPSELRARASARRRRQRLALGSGGSLVLAVSLAVTLTLPSNVPTRPPSGHTHTAASVTRLVVAPGSASEVRVEASEQQFALGLTQRLVSPGQVGNVIVSPESIETVLTMLELGARGSTLHEIAAVLDGSRLSPSDEAAGWNALTAELARDADSSGGSLTDANVVFVQKTLGLRQAYRNALVRNFGVNVRPVDFQQGSAAAAIDSWASAATGGRIASPVAPSSLSRLTSLVAADIVRFSATWKYPFTTSFTTSGPFRTAGGQSVNVDMMRLAQRMTYFSTSALEGVVLPFAGGKVEAVVVQPGSGSISSLVDHLTPAALTALGASTHVGSVDLAIPKFSIDSAVSLDGSLQRLGLRRAFLPGADFSGIAGSHMTLGTVAQQDQLSINETGTDVVAASSGTTDFYQGRGSIQRITFDQPFLFVIRDIATGAIITEAVVNDPSSPR